MTIDWRLIPATGTIRLEDGELRAYDRLTGELVGRVIVGRSGLMVLNLELAGFQPNDPFKFRALSDYAGGRGALGGFSAGTIRQDGTADELASIMATLAEDAQPGERRSQIQISIVAPSGEIEPVWVATSAYAIELFGAFITWIGMASPQGSLLKFRPPVRDPLPPIDPPPVDPPPPLPIEYPPGTESIREGDFAALSAFYGGIDLADEFSDWQASKMPWVGPRTGFSVLWMAWRKAGGGDQ